ncbi:hypothetical protein RRG08_023397 [Elysia crispata]|uniref:Uncharacterized protein n=1 Tax=Elysia crispata TaxID=231223 RepID=A0AAE0YEU2_9GAST|nr:hypothetical protein RRG08_023397 [Elysia crispata]
MLLDQNVSHLICEILFERKSMALAVTYVLCGSGAGTDFCGKGYNSVWKTCGIYADVAADTFAYLVTELA